MSSTYNKGALIGASLESVLYGLYLILFPLSVLVLLHRYREGRGQKRTNIILLVGDGLLFLFVTGGWILDQRHLWRTFVDGNTDSFSLPRVFTLGWSNVNAVRLTFYVFPGVILDFMLLYRLYVVWQYDWRVVVPPTLTFVASVAIGSFAMTGIDKVTLSGSFDGLKISCWIIAELCLHLATNILAVAFIAARVLQCRIKVHAINKEVPSSIIAALIESAGINCLMNIVVMIMCVIRSRALYLALLPASPIMGISFCIITLRVGLRHWLDQFTKPPAGAVVGSQASRRTIPLFVNVTSEEFSKLHEDTAMQARIEVPERAKEIGWSSRI